MPKARVTSKGQVTIPREVREQLHIRTGDELLFIPLGDRLMVERVHRPTVAQLAGALRVSIPDPGDHGLKDEAERAAVREVIEEW